MFNFHKTILLFLLILSGFVLTGNASSANGGIVSKKELYFNFDYALFRDADGSAILEIYYSVPQKFLKYEKTDKGFEAAIRIDVQIKNKLDGSVIVSEFYKTPSLIKDTSNQASYRNLIGQLNYSLKPGTYTLMIKGSDFSEEKSADEYDTDLIVDANSAGNSEISDIQLASTVQKSDNTNSTFYKNTLEVIPNPAGLYGTGLPEMYYYAELFSLTPANLGGNYSVVYTILSSNNDTLFRSVKEFQTKAVSKVDFGKFQVDTLQSGTYRFSIALFSSDNMLKAESDKKFYIFSGQAAVNEKDKSGGFLTSEFANMSDKQLADEYEKMIYIMPEKQYEQYKLFKSIDDKRKYLYNFWKSIDPKPETPMLESRINYLKMVNEANQAFKESYNKGWKTDRGRIYIVYGKPDDIERYPFETSTKSYEVWKYNAVEGGGECQFIELQPMTGIYWLVNSTFRNELQNPNWREQLRPK